MSYSQRVLENIPVEWSACFETVQDELSESLQLVEDKIANGEDVVPYPEDLFNAFHYTSPNNIKVVILGQDPYPQYVQVGGQAMPRANGLAFSVRREDPNIPVSLKNIFKEVKSCIPTFNIPEHGDLSAWANEGVFLLNTSLTVQSGLASETAGGHKSIWHSFVIKILRQIKKINPNVIFVLWGKKAEELFNKSKIVSNNLLKSSHPSGLSAKGFFGKNHFAKINKHLAALQDADHKAGRAFNPQTAIIDWSL